MTLSVGDSRAFQALLTDLVENILRYSDNPGACAQYVTTQIRELIGVRQVAMISCESGMAYRVVGVCPPRSEADWRRPEIRAFVTRMLSSRVPQSIDPATDPAGESLLSIGIGKSMVIPLLVGDDRVGMLVLLEFMDEKGTRTILEAVSSASRILALILKNSLLYSSLEQRVEARTAELREKNEELMRARDMAEKASRAKSQFLATMSHELRTPLNPVLGFADMLAESPNLTDEQRVWLRIISQRGQDLLGMIGSVLDLAKIEADKIVINREPLLLRQTIRDLAESVAPAANKKGLALEWIADEDLPENILADGFRLRQVLLNLLNNAIKFTNTGCILLRVEHAQAGERSSADPVLLFSIRDTGIGIPPDRQATIFEAFVSADPKEAVKYGGAGLGLTIALRLVELMGGRIWVESEPGRGSTFRFTLRVGQCPAAEPAADGAGVAQVASAARPLRVLIVEDDPSSLRMAELMVRKEGHSVQMATDGQQAVALAAAETFDLILMDVQMPVMDGVEATQRIREREEKVRAESENLKPEGAAEVSGLKPQVSSLRSHPLHRTRIIGLTAYAMQGDRERFLAAGMDGYLPKPVTMARLREMLQTTCACNKA